MHRPAIRLSLIAVLVVPLLVGCVSTRPDTAAAAPSAARKPAPVDLLPGEQVDYAGHRCGNPNFHVKTHPCVFPKRDVTP
ncbi:hypothetical protein [Burkholderia sp. Bp9143]|uniref:hypothetical protein n=1 Tax=Burkholderia sp. Bp9143 TaxID=2184574 RepID=UPI0021AB5FD6|nr:hypothetical protein [Burkholderia sp. Bp9143]